MSELEENVNENLESGEDHIISLSGMYKEWFWIMPLCHIGKSSTSH